jgi:hypothetical protein
MNGEHSSGDIKARAAALTLIVPVLAGSLLFRLLIWGELEHTSLVFIGIPAVMAILVALMPTPKSATGLILKVMTLALLVSGIAFGEAFVCILFAAPLFFLIGIVVGQLIDLARRRRPNRLDLRLLFLMAVVLTPASLEGVLPGFEFERDEIVTVVRLVNASSDQIRSALAHVPRFDRPLPLFLRLGFPMPGATAGSGLEPGDSRQIEFLHGHHPGLLTLTVVRSEPGRVSFIASDDTSYITHWLSWQSAVVTWREITADQSEVRWTLRYRRRLDPAWYFEPLERYGVGQAAGYLIDALATPMEARHGS